MKAFTRILAALPISAALLVSGCSMNRADSLRMLDRRAEYEASGVGDPNLALKEAGIEGFRNSPMPVRTRAKVASVWIHPHETASRDYFWGGWVSLVIEEPQWMLTKPGAAPRAPGVVDASKRPPGKKPTKRVTKPVPAGPPSAPSAPM